eukprot:151996-Lingulodinium_polyedra.AAC.1
MAQRTCQQVACTKRECAMIKSATALCKTCALIVACVNSKYNSRFKLIATKGMSMHWKLVQ